MISFDDVQDYLTKKVTRSSVDSVGKLTLQDIKEQIGHEKEQLKGLLRNVTLKREAEKVEELRQLKLRHQQRRAQRNKEETEIKALISELEKAKESELRVRLDKEQIQHVLQSVEEADMRRMEEEKRLELERLAREREVLIRKEDEVQKELSSLHGKIEEQELEFRKRKGRIDSVLQNRKSGAKDQMLELAQARGERLASLALERQELTSKRQQLDAQLVKIESSSNFKKGAGLNNLFNKVKRKRRRARRISNVAEALGKGGINTTQQEGSDSEAEDEDGEGDTNAFDANALADSISSKMVDAELKLLQLKREAEDQNKMDLDFKQQVEAVTDKLGLPDTRTQRNFVDQVESYLNDERTRVAQRIAASEPATFVPPLSDALDKLQSSVSGQAERGAINPVPSCPKNPVPGSPWATSHQPHSPVPQEEPRTNFVSFSSQGSTEPVASPQDQSKVLDSPKGRIHSTRSAAFSRTARSVLKSPGTSAKDATNSPNRNSGLRREVEMLKQEYSVMQVPDPGLWAEIESLEAELMGHKRNSNQLPSSYPPAHMPPYNHPYWPQSAWAPPVQPLLSSAPYVTVPGGEPQLGGASGVLQQQQEEIDRLTQELENIVNEQRSQERDEDKSMLSSALERIGDAINAFANSKNTEMTTMRGDSSHVNTNDPASNSDNSSMLSFVQDQANTLKLLKSLPKESHIYRLQVNHMQEMAKLKFEMEALVQKKKLVKLKEELEQEELEAQKKAEHEKWKAEQSRQLAEARIRKVLAKENVNIQSWDGAGAGNNSANEALSLEYDPQEGFMVYFDYCMNVPKRISHMRVVYCIYDGTVSKTRAKALPLSESERDSEYLVTCTFAARRLFQRVVAKENLRIAIELQSVSEDEVTGKTRTQSVGWGVIQLFKHVTGLGTILREGPVKVKMIRPPLNVDLFDQVERGVGLNTGQRQDKLEEPLQPVGELEMFLRLVNFANGETAANFAVDPQLTSHLYRYPYTTQKARVRGERRGHARRRSLSRQSSHRAMEKSHLDHPGSSVSEEEASESEEETSPGRSKAVKSHTGTEQDRESSNPTASKTTGSNLGVGGEDESEESNAILVQFNYLTMRERVADLSELGSYKCRLGLVLVDKSRRASHVVARRGSVASRRGSVASRRGSLTRASGDEGEERRGSVSSTAGPRVHKLASAETNEVGYSAESDETQLTWNQEVTLRAAPQALLDGEVLLVVELYASTEDSEFGLVAWGMQRLGIESRDAGKVSFGPRTLRLFHGSRVSFESLRQGDQPFDEDADVICLSVLPSAARRQSHRRGSVPPALPAVEAEGSESSSDGSRSSGSPTHAEAQGLRGWIKHVASPVQSREDGGQQELFRRGDDGFDVYVDSARYLPDNVTVTMAQVKLLTRDFEVLGPVYAGYPGLDDSAFSPRYNLRAEFRGEEVAHPSATLVVRIDGVDKFSGKTTVIGYSLINAFVGAARGGQPEVNTEQNFLLNAGAFQLPLLQRSPDQSQPLTCDTLRDSPRIPCATVLLRILPAATSRDGLTTLCAADYDEDEWEARGILVPAPDYAKAVYDSSRCVPLPCEAKMYPFRAERDEPLVRELAVLIGSLETSAEALEALEDIELEAFVREKLEAPEGFVDMSKVAEYQMELGFKVGVDLATNLAFGGGLRSNAGVLKVVYSLSPPGSYYEEPKLTEEVQFTTAHDWTSSVYNQWFNPGEEIKGSDNMHIFRDVPGDPFLCLVLDAKVVRWKKGQMVCEDHGWTVLPVFEEGFVRNGCHQLPLFQGRPSKEFLQELEGEKPMDVISNELAKKKQGRLKLKPSCSSLVVRLIDTQLENVVELDANKSLTKDYLPDKTMAKFNCLLERLPKEKKPLSKLLPKEFGSTAEFEKELNKQFAAHTEILHYAL